MIDKEIVQLETLARAEINARNDERKIIADLMDDKAKTFSRGPCCSETAAKALRDFASELRKDIK